LPFDYIGIDPARKAPAGFPGTPVPAAGAY